MRHKAANSGIWKFLELSGVLDTGTNEDIAQKRKEYWNLRKRISKQEKRKKETEFKICLDNKEILTISLASKKHGISRTRYIKLAALAYKDNKYLIPDQAAVNHITQLLSLNYSSMQEMSETMPSNMVDILLQKIESLEQQVLAALCNPQIKSPAL